MILLVTAPATASTTVSPTSAATTTAVATATTYFSTAYTGRIFTEVSNSLDLYFCWVFLNLIFTLQKARGF